MANQPPPEFSPFRTWDAADRVATEFEDALHRGERPPLRAEVQRVSPGDRERLLIELIGLEIVHRRGAGEVVGLADYESEFPELHALASADRDELLDWIERSIQDAADRRPARIGRYPIVAELDGGGQARTFRAVHPVLKTTVVLKLARQKAAPGELDRIGREGRLLAALPPHRHLVRVHDVDLHNGRVYLVLEDVPGTTLEQYARSLPFDARWAARTVAAIAGAVHVVHELGITHQDLNPRNILIDREGQPRVIDFGMAWHRPWWAQAGEPNSIGGTPHYLSPEQAWGQIDRIGRPTDVFGLGGILFYLLTDSPLYPDGPLLTVLNKARELDFDRGRLDRRGIPPRLREICLKALAREPGVRFATAADFARALERFLKPRGLVYRAMLAAVFMVAFGLAWVIRGRQPEGTSSQGGVAPPAMQVRIWRSDKEFQPLLKALPLRSGDEVQVRCRVPRGQHVTMFLVNGLGSLRPLEQFPASDTDREIIYPGPGQTQVLQGPPGTEMILAVARPDGRVPEEVSRLWEGEPGGTIWPALPRATMVHLRADGVEIEGEHSRELGEIHDRSDPLEGIRLRLERLRERLKGMSPFFEGVAFGHE